MNKSGIMIVSALLTMGVAAGAMAADMPKSAAPMSADAASASSTSADAPKTSKKHKKHKKAAPASIQ